jgi:hypothetical protein
MKVEIAGVIAFLAIFCLSGWGPFSFFSPAPLTARVGTRAWLEEEMSKINSQANNINKNVLKLSLAAYIRARHKGLDTKQLLTIVDYTKPSTERRLWVVDLKSAKVLFNTWVTHGKNSGTINATSFSNQPGSLKSSLGVFVTTGSPYVGGNGYSLRLLGLEQGINDKAFERDIVVHGAWYANPNVVKRYGFLGRSWGCLAVNEGMIHPLINTIKDNTLVFVYYPDKNWLNHSSFLAG